MHSSRKFAHLTDNGNHTSALINRALQRDGYFEKNNLKGVKEPMPEDCRERLRDFFREDMNQLADVVDFNINDWK